MKGNRVLQAIKNRTVLPAIKRRVQPAIEQGLKSASLIGSDISHSTLNTFHTILSKRKAEQAPLFSSPEEALGYQNGDLFKLSQEDVFAMYAKENNISLEKAMAELSDDDKEFILLAGKERQNFSESTPPVIIIDNFYDDPDSIRQFSLNQNFIKYNRFGWFTTELWPLLLEKWPLPREWLLDRFEGILGYPLCREYPNFELSSWQGSLHYKVTEPFYSRACVIHSHVSDSFMGFNAVIGLNPDGNAETTLWKNTKTGKCIAISRPLDSSSEVNFELCLRIPLLYNRCILFRNDVYHRGEPGWGTDVEDSRMFQTFLGLDPQINEEKTAASQDIVYKNNFHWWLDHNVKEGCDPDELKRVREIAHSAGTASFPS